MGKWSIREEGRKGREEGRMLEGSIFMEKRKIIYVSYYGRDKVLKRGLDEGKMKYKGRRKERIKGGR